ncbi:MAG TPA: hypothetical protein VFA41_17165 [Ktedonobacteraceae bacterium]|jgi:hypothetical protein|nr:hypothetical protein [Ktedonobacteraceae bacterium]HZS78345.1 hypothetical protein [Ktedonobacteraceae bacterium]
MYAPPPSRLKRFTSWWQRQRLLVKIGCILLLLPVCGFCGSAAAVGTYAGIYEGITGQSPFPTPTPTQTGQVAQVLTTRAASPTRVVPTRAITPTPKPTHAPSPTPTQRPTPTPRPQPTSPPPTPTPSCQAVNNNPWCYNFSPGSLIYNPPSAFCDYFPCISSFWNGQGYVVECQDGDYSLSGGVQGACSHHGGELRPLYSH